VPVQDLGNEAAELLSLTSLSEARSLSRLAELAVSQVPGCSAASASVWRDGELISVSATHPDAAELSDLQIEAGEGPLITAARDGVPVNSPDALDERRWPGYADAALVRGVRCCAHLVREFPPLTLVLSLSGVRPRTLDADNAPMAEMLAAFGRAMLANTMMYGEAQRTATQLKDSVASRAVVDQAKGVLMHALRCGPDTALEYLRKESQRRHIKVTEVAAQVIASHGKVK
jgi:hypothetical protein